MKQRQDMTWIKFWILTVLVVVNICACGSQARWQRQYDLGMQYLTNGDYEEAIVAFSAAIEIEPNQALAYVGRGGAYIGSGETDVNLTAAMEDYQKALELDDTNEGAYLGAADVYIRRGEFEMAEEILQTGLDKTGSEEIRRKIEEIQSGTIADASGKTRMSSHFENGALIEYWLYDYDEKGNNIRTTCYDADGSWSSTETHSFDANGYMTETILERGMGGQTQEVSRNRTTYEYDEQGREIRSTRTDLDTGELESYDITSYDDNTRTEIIDTYGADNNLQDRFIMEYDENWVRTRGSAYRPDENGELYLEYYVEYLWNPDGTYAGFEHYDVAGQDGE